MKETHITIYIHDLEISDKSKSFLARVGLMKLDDLLNCNMTELSAIRNISEDVLQELNGVIAHSDVIISFFEERAKRIREILPNVQDAPIESLGLGTRATNTLVWTLDLPMNRSIGILILASRVLCCKTLLLYSVALPLSAEF